MHYFSTFCCMDTYSFHMWSRKQYDASLVLYPVSEKRGLYIFIVTPTSWT